MEFFNFLEFFCYFFVIFYYALGRNETERQDLLSLFLGIFQPILALNEAIMEFFNFFAFFLAFSIPGRVGTEQIDKFYFLSFSFFSALFWLKIKPKCDFLVF